LDSPRPVLLSRVLTIGVACDCGKRAILCDMRLGPNRLGR
jgi:hypothetical protein